MFTTKRSSGTERSILVSIGCRLIRTGSYSTFQRGKVVRRTTSMSWMPELATLSERCIFPIDRTPADLGLLHGIGWTPDQTEVWEGSTASDPHIYVWDMLDPMVPVLKERLTLRSGRGTHWLTFDIIGDYGYVAPNKIG